MPLLLTDASLRAQLAAGVAISDVSRGDVITSAGSHLGSTVSAVTGHLANRIRPISPAASGVLKHAGRAADYQSDRLRLGQSGRRRH